MADSDGKDLKAVIAETIERWRQSDSFVHRFSHLINDREAWEKAQNDDLAHWIVSAIQRFESSDQKDAR